MDRSLPRKVHSRTRTGSPKWTADLDPSCTWPYKRKDQCGEVALAFDDVVGSGFAFNRGEGQRQVQPAELGLDPGDVFLQERGEVTKLFLDPLPEVPLGYGYNDADCLMAYTVPDCTKGSPAEPMAIGAAIGAAIGTGIDALRLRRVFRGTKARRSRMARRCSSALWSHRTCN